MEEHKSSENQRDNFHSLINYSKEGWLVIFSGFCLHLLLACLFLWGDLMIYIFSYLRQYDPNVSLMSLSWVFPFTYLLYQIVMTNIEYFIEKFQIIRLAFVCIACFTLTFFLISMTQNSKLFSLIFIIGVGCSLGILNILPIFCGLKYFPSNKNRVIGLIQLGGGIGVLFLGFLSYNFINFTELSAEVLTLKNIYFNECVADQIPKFLKILAIVYMILGFVSLSYLQVPALPIEKSSESVLRRSTNENKISGMVFLFLFSLLSMEGFFFLMFYKTIGLGKLMEDKELLWVGTVGISFIWFLKVFWNYISSNVAIVKIIFLQVAAKILIIYDFSYLLGLILEFASLSGVLSINSKVFAKITDFDTAKKFNKMQGVLLGLSSLFICYLKESLIFLGPSFLWLFLTKDLICFVLWMFSCKTLKESEKTSISALQVKNKEEKSSAHYYPIEIQGNESFNSQV